MISRRTVLFRGSAVAGVASLALAGCGGDEATTSGDGDMAIVTVWDRAGAEANARQPFIDDWNETQGAEIGIQIDYVPQAIDRYEEVINQGFQTDRAPDIFHAPSSQLGAYVAAGWVVPLDGLVSDDVLAAFERYLPSTSELVWAGRPYGIPTTSFTNRLMINRDVFEAAELDPDNPPKTFSEVEAAAQAITESSGGETHGIALPVAWVGFRDWLVDLHVMAANPDLTQNGLFNIETGEFEAAKYEATIKHYQTLIEEGWAAPGASTMDIPTAVSAFAEGQVGMLLGSAGSTSAVDQLETGVSVAAGPIPVADGQELVRSPMNAGFPYSISSTAANPEVVAQVLEVLVSNDMQAALADFGIPPASQEVWDVAVEANPLLELFTINDSDEQWPKKPGGVVPVEGETATATIEKLILDPSAGVAAELEALQERYQDAWDRGSEQGLFDPEEFLK